MGFLDKEPDLTDTIYSANDHQYAREFLRSAIERHDPSWLKQPVGPLGRYWLATDTYSICYLIELARILDTLQPNVTKKSQSSYVEKFCALLRCISVKQYEELLTEFQVANILSERVSPIAFEPLVPESLFRTSRQPKSPDFAVRLPEADVFAEVTVIRFGALDNWDRRMKNLSEHLHRAVLKRHLRRAIALAFPLSAGSSDLPTTLQRQLVSELLDNECGEWITDALGEKAVVKWVPFPHIDSDPGHVTSDWSPIYELEAKLGLRAGELSATIGPENMPAVGTWNTIVRDDYLDDLFVKSVRNSLDQKRIQFRHLAPYLLVIKLGHHRLIASAFEHLLKERIWPNKDYAWITGLCLFSPRTAFRKSDPGASIFLNLNPNARVQASASLLDLFAGRKQFHS